MDTLMKKIVSIVLICLKFNFFASAYNIKSDVENKQLLENYFNNRTIRFIENKGQLTNTEHKPVPFVLFKAQAPGMSVYITEKGLTYVFTKTETQIEGENVSEKQELTSQQQVNSKRYKTEMAWVNVILKNATINRDNIIKEGRSEEHFNYFYGHCPDGMNNVFEYDKITIKNIYPNIDWVIYNSTKNGFKYDFIVHPGADPSLIKLIYDSEKPLDVDSQGNISIITPLGTLTEQAPYSYLLNSKKEVKSSFRRRQINSHQVEISFGLFNDYDDQNETGSFGNETLIIDPQMVWGTYYGSNTATSTGPGDGTEMRGVDNDASGNLFATGHTWNSFFSDI